MQVIQISLAQEKHRALQQSFRYSLVLNLFDDEFLQDSNIFLITKPNKICFYMDNIYKNILLSSIIS